MYELTKDKKYELLLRQNVRLYEQQEAQCYAKKYNLTRKQKINDVTILTTI